MPVSNKAKRLKKELKLLDVYAIATGTTLSAGFFILPGLAAAQTGPAMILSYLLAAIPLIPAMFCLMELATAMPRAGGTYYFLDRSMGPVIGTIGGLGTWFSLLLKTAFALIGMGAYLNLFIAGDYLILLAIGFAVFFGVLNLIGAKETGLFQIILVVGVLLLLGGFIGNGLLFIDTSHFSGFFAQGAQSIFATAGLVYISYAGVTKVTSVSEEVENPERNLPLGMFLAFGTVLVIYGLGTYVMVGVLPKEQLYGNLTPLASVADHVAGWWGKVLITIAAVLAFSSSTNVGILSSSRYPLAMSRDHLMPSLFRGLSKRSIPTAGVLVSVGLIIIFIVFLNPMKIAKLASAFQLLMFALCCLAVVIMRESHIEAYDPGYHAPWYPWLQIIGIGVPFFLIAEMGWMPLIFSVGLIGLGIIWYYIYARKRVARGGAILHVFERLGRRRHEGLEPELREILKEKGLRDYDPFDEVVSQAQVMDLEQKQGFDQIIQNASALLSEKVPYEKEIIESGILQGTKIGATPVSHGVALPHIRLKHIEHPVLLLVRAKMGVHVDMGEEFWGEHTPEGPINAIFFLASPDSKPRQHLRILAQIAGRVDDDEFMSEWLSAENEQDLKLTLLGAGRFISLLLVPRSKSGSFIGKAIRDLTLPEGSLIAMINRDGQEIIPRGSTVLEEGDRLIIIGEQKGIQQLRNMYGKNF